MTVTLPLPFRNSRGLAHANALLGEPCVALEVVGLELEATLYEGWRRRVEHVAHALGWPVPRFVTLNGPTSPTLCFTTPGAQLQTAREANEWALCASLVERDPSHWGALREALRVTAAATPVDLERPCMGAEIDERKALERLRRLGTAEAQAVVPA